MLTKLIALFTLAFAMTFATVQAHAAGQMPRTPDAVHPISFPHTN